MSETIFRHLEQGIFITADATPETARFVYIYRSASPPVTEISFSEAWAAADTGVFCFVPHLPPDFAAFADKARRNYIHRNLQYLLWIGRPEQYDWTDGFRVSTKNANVLQQFYLPFRNSALRIPTHCLCRINDARDGFVLTPHKQAPQLIRTPGGGAPDMEAATSAVELRLAAKEQGLVRFGVQLTEADLNALEVGLRYFRGPAKQVASFHYPVFSVPQGATVNLQAQFDPYALDDPGRSRYRFCPGESIGSYFRNACGQKLQLTAASTNPPGLVFADRPPRPEDGRYEPVYLLPEGEFAIGKEAASGACQLLCGLSGTETIGFAPETADPGGILAFHPGQPAWAEEFPFPQASPVGRPFDATRPLLAPGYTTAWLSLRGAAKSCYSSQPAGMSLYGQSGPIPAQSPRLLGFVEPLTALPDPPPALPMAPYAGIKAEGPAASGDREQLQAFESQILSPTRRGLIAASQGLSTARAPNRTVPAEAPQSLQAVTPQGLVVEVQADGRWTDIHLARSGDRSAVPFGLNEIAPEVQQAFQTNQLLLVATDAGYLGRADALGEGSGPLFHNRVSLAGWEFQVNVGSGNRYGDYRNLLILKYRQGALAELVRTPSAWTQATDFNLGAGAQDASELVIISQWLQDYIARGIAEWQGPTRNPLYRKFAAIVRDPDWQGILCLRVDVAAFPDQLQGILGAIDAERFYAHHLGIEANHFSAEGGLHLDAESSLFGLIAYLDANYEENLRRDPQAADKPVRPAPNSDYDFKVLTLQALFENSRVTDFRSKAQLTVNRLFGDRVAGINGAPDTFNSLVLDGSYQNQSGENLYIFERAGSDRLAFDSNVLASVTLTRIQFNTREQQQTSRQEGAAEGEKPIRSYFSLWGVLDFRPLAGMDVFSFGSTGEKTSGDEGPAVGLSFAQLGIEMSFPPDNPAARSFALDSRHISFDLKQSTPRPPSLYPNFALQLNGLLSGDVEKQPADLGYLPVTTSIPTSGLGDEWHGLECTLNLGTPGALAGKAGLQASLLLAWSPGGTNADQSYRVHVGLKLPGTDGARLMNLQGVIKLSIDDVALQYVEEKKSYLLTLSDIALKFLGIAKLPPGGRTSFYLFGNPEPGADISSLGWYAIYNKEQS